MAAPITKAEWNELIDQINSIRQDPPDGCDPLPAIDSYPNTTAFSKTEVQRVRDALADTCPDITFPELATPQLIVRELLTDIQDKLDQAWCDCEECDPQECDPGSEDGTEIIVLEKSPVVYSNCFGKPGIGSGPGESEEVQTTCDLVGGLTVGASGITGRTWTLTIKNQFNPSGTVVAGGNINCEGVVDCSFPANVFVGYGISVVCGTLEAPDCDGDCEDAITNAEDTISSWQSWRAILTINGGSGCDSDCDGTADCDEEDG